MKKDIIVFSGPSGVGKSTLVKMLQSAYPDFQLSVSAVTREPRPHEVNGREYYFLSQEEFQGKIDEGAFIEWEEVYPGIRYGSLHSEVDRILSEGGRVVFDIEVLGAMNIKRIYGDRAHLIFVKPESVPALEARLRDRGTDSEESIQKRIARFEKELSYEERFDSVLVNRTGELKEAEENLMQLLKKIL